MLTEVKQSGCPLSFAEAKSLDKAKFQCCIFVVHTRLSDEVRSNSWVAVVWSSIARTS